MNIIKPVAAAAGLALALALAACGTSSPAAGSSPAARSPEGPGLFQAAVPGRSQGNSRPPAMS